MELDGRLPVTDERVGDGVAGTDRGLELHLVDARGGAGDAWLLAEAAQAILFGKERIDHAAMADADCVPAGGDEAAEMAVPGGVRIDVEILRVVELTEADDLGLGEVVAAEREDFVDGDVLEPARHGFSPSMRGADGIAQLDEIGETHGHDRLAATGCVRRGRW